MKTKKKPQTWTLRQIRDAWNAGVMGCCADHNGFMVSFGTSTAGRNMKMFLLTAKRRKVKK